MKQHQGGARWSIMQWEGWGLLLKHFRLGKLMALCNGIVTMQSKFQFRISNLDRSSARRGVGARISGIVATART